MPRPPPQLPALKPEPWMALAACRGRTAEFYPEPGERPSEEALATCAACGVRRECGEYALASGQEYGVWAGRVQDPPSRRQRSRRREQEGATMAPMAAKVDPALETVEPTGNGTAPELEDVAAATSSAEEDPPRRCDWCDEPLKPDARPNQRWCSRTCSNRAVEARRQAAIVEARRGRTGDELGRLVAAVFDAGAVLEVEFGPLRLVARR